MFLVCLGSFLIVLHSSELKEITLVVSCPVNKHFCSFPKSFRRELLTELFFYELGTKWVPMLDACMLKINEIHFYLNCKLFDCLVLSWKPKPFSNCPPTNEYNKIIKIPFSKWKNKNFMLIYILSLILLHCYVLFVFPYRSPFVRLAWTFTPTHIHSTLSFITRDSCAFCFTRISYSNTGFLCLVIYRRDTHVVELQIGNLTSRLEDACAPDQYDVTRTPFTTLLGE